MVSGMSPISSEKERAAVALLELADALRKRAGERALLVAEELAFQQVFRDGGAVDGDERFALPRAVLENGARDEFLARAAFAGDENGRAGRRDLADELVDLLHRGRAADDRLPQLIRSRLGGKRRRLLPDGAGDAERLEKQVLQVRNVERLEHVVVRPQFHRLDRGLRGAVGGHHDDNLARVDLPDLLQRIEAALLAHADVHHDEVGMRLFRDADALVARLGAQDVERLLFQQAAEGIMDVLLIVDDENARPKNLPRLRRRWGLRAGGSNRRRSS